MRPVHFAELEMVFTARHLEITEGKNIMACLEMTSRAKGISLNLLGIYPRGAEFQTK